MEKHNKLKGIVEGKTPFKAYVTKYALKNGILIQDIYHRFDEPSTVAVHMMWDEYRPLVKGEWFYTLEDAIANVEFRIEYKLKSMQREMDKLRKRVIPVIPNSLD